MSASALQLLSEMRAAGRPAGHDVRPGARARAFRETEGQTMTLRRAAAFTAALDAMTPHLYAGDHLAGSLAAPFTGAEAATAADHDLLARIGERSFATHSDHVIVDFPRLLRLGFPGIRAEITGRLEHPDLDDRGRHFLASAGIAVDAAIRTLGCYADACAVQAAGGEARWREMAARCARLAEGPPSSFADAVQLVWFAHHLLSLEGRYANGFGRLDQYLLPFYQADLARGTVTPAGALELLAHLWVKIGERTCVYGSDDVANIAIGGVTPTGEDGTNALSFLCLAATRAIRIPGPNLSARIHPDCPDAFLHACIETIGTGVGYPALFNDAVIVPALEAIGVPTEEARDYAPVGCIETFLPGKQPPWSDGRFNLAKYLELALNNGCDLRGGERLGPENGDARGFDSFAQVQDAVRVQIAEGMRRYAQSYRERNAALDPAQFTSPFLSALMTDCISCARDVNDGGTRYPSNHGVGGMALGTITDSLAAIRQGVFVEGRFSMETLLAALRADFKGYEELRAWAWQQAPKYGNDDPAADDLAVWVSEVFTDAVLAERTYDGGRFLPLIAANVQNISGGKETAATPDGRGAGHPLSDAASPTYGRDTHGPTAVVRSATRLNWRKVTGGSVINQKYHPGLLATPEGRAGLAGLLRGFFALGGQEMQFNAVTPETLRDAMAHPDRYRDLVVRVSGFSARFTTLSPEVQADILARTTHAGRESLLP